MANRAGKTESTRWLPLFLSFVEKLEIDSKEIGRGFLGENLYEAQLRFLTEVCEGLDRGIRHFVCLKARQLGISTISLAMDLFWLFVHPGLQGALITDDDANRDKFRIILSGYLEKMPKDYRVGVRAHNKNNLVLANGSVLDYLVAGKRKGGSLGISRALNFVHATEVSRYGDPQGLDNLMASTAQTYPDRLYIFESTAHGFNNFTKMWNHAGLDEDTKKRFFIGWWAKETYSIPRKDARLEKYWDGNLTDDEREKCQKVFDLYGVNVKPQQIAWFRWNETTQSTDDGANQENYPWTEHEAWVMSGNPFFRTKQVSAQLEAVIANPHPSKSYRYHLGKNFLETELEEASSIAGLPELTIWENYDPDGFYVLGCDPPTGRDDNKITGDIEVYRCYADRLVQVAEYSTDNPETYQLAWVMFHLAGAYRNCMVNLEVNGTGTALMQQRDTLKQQMDTGYLQIHASQVGLKNIFENVRWYLYHRPDSTGGGYNYNLSATTNLQITIMNQLRDAYALNELVVRSPLLLEEMQTIEQLGASIRGDVDGRTYASAFAVKAWIEWIRPGLISRNETFATVQKRNEEKGKPAVLTMPSYVVADFFKKIERQRSLDEYEKAMDS